MHYVITETITLEDDPHLRYSTVFKTSYKVAGLKFDSNYLSSSIDTSDIKTLRANAVIAFERKFPGNEFSIEGT